MHRSPILNLVTISISCVGSLLTQITCYLKITSLLSPKKAPRTLAHAIPSCLVSSYSSCKTQLEALLCVFLGCQWG